LHRRQRSGHLHPLSLARRKYAGLALVAVIFAAGTPGPAEAARHPTAKEFRQLEAAVAKNPHGAYYCAERKGTWLSTLRPRWALAQMRSNCGLGSQTVRFFLVRTGKTQGWRIAERRYEQLGAGRGIPCGSPRVPRDIRCGPKRQSCRRVSPPAPKRAKFDSPRQIVDLAKPLTAVVRTNCGNFQIALDAQRAPLTVNSFAFLAKMGFYDGLTFHRVVPGFVIQGGDPHGDGRGGPGYSVDEPPPADLVYERGVVAMAKSLDQGPGRSGSQFFIVLADAELPPEYALLGRVSSGMKVVQRIGRLGTPSEQPRQTVLIKRIAIRQG
jgi:peptidyl-prolyl cis-trans isomerase B (cyclophilin B)